MVRAASALSPCGKPCDQVELVGYFFAEAGMNDGVAGSLVKGFVGLWNEIQKFALPSGVAYRIEYGFLHFFLPT
jgi:hypothetical protein